MGGEKRNARIAAKFPEMCGLKSRSRGAHDCAAEPPRRLSLGTFFRSPGFSLNRRKAAMAWRRATLPFRGRFSFMPRDPDWGPVTGAAMVFGAAGGSCQRDIARKNRRARAQHSQHLTVAVFPKEPKEGYNIN